jgi:hypothetical protein
MQQDLQQREQRRPRGRPFQKGVSGNPSGSKQSKRYIHRIAVIRAAKKIPGLDYWAGENLGKQLVFYDPLNVMSYAMARLKA